MSKTSCQCDNHSGKYRVICLYLLVEALVADVALVQLEVGVGLAVLLQRHHIPRPVYMLQELVKYVLSKKS